MQDVQNIPNPDVNSTQRDDDFGSHSEISDTDIEQPTDNQTPPDRKPSAPIEEPPAEDGEEEPRRIL
jgi:hypothetical protein